MRADSADPEQINQLFTAIDRKFGRIDVLVNNAAIIAQQSRLEDLEFERMRHMFAVNSIGPILCAQQAVRRMSYRHNGRGGVVINISSASARLGSPNEYVDYAASKGALETFTIGFAKEVARDGIRVNCIRPGHIYTEMHASGGEPGRVDRVKDSIPMGRGGQPEEVARAILWLAGAQASFITGTFLVSTKDAVSGFGTVCLRGYPLHPNRRRCRLCGGRRTHSALWSWDCVLDKAMKPPTLLCSVASIAFGAGHEL
jgi:NAD(P)-dependent dehydrogenase (short-subunit alcohol dehydrogenase family)